MTRAMAATPKYRDTKPLPPLSEESRARLEKARAAKADKKRKAAVAQADKKKEKKTEKKDGGCEVM